MFLDGLFGAIGNIASTGISAGSSAAIAKENREWNEKMWHMQNEYNTPLAQMQRLKDAGLNPNLAYGQLASSNAGPVGSADVYGNKEITSALSKLNIIEAGVSIAKAIQEIKKTREDSAGQSLDNEIKMQEIERNEAELEAIARYSAEHSAYGIKQLSEGKHLVRVGKSWQWSDVPESYPNDTGFLGHLHSQYFYDKLLYNLQNIAAGRDLKQAQKGATDAIKALRNLDIPYFSTRNRWQPVNYGVDAITKAINSVFGAYGKFR